MARKPGKDPRSLGSPWPDRTSPASANRRALITLGTSALSDRQTGAYRLSAQEIDRIKKATANNIPATGRQSQQSTLAPMQAVFHSYFRVELPSADCEVRSGPHRRFVLFAG